LRSTEDHLVSAYDIADGMPRIHTTATDEKHGLGVRLVKNTGDSERRFDKPDTDHSGPLYP
jgi:hypothetical protein